jgi:hypothetical protein
MEKGGEALAAVHNNQVVNGRGGRKMEEKIEGGAHKGNNRSGQFDGACTGLGERGDGYVNKKEGSL